MEKLVETILEKLSNIEAKLDHSRRSDVSPPPQPEPRRSSLDTPPPLPPPLPPLPPHRGCPPAPPSRRESNSIPPHRSSPPPPPPPPRRAPSASQPVVPPSSTSRRLPSAAINKSLLSSVEAVLRKNENIVGREGKMGTLTVLLARECFFGEDVMVQCTTHGYGGKPGLPIAELMELKAVIRRSFPKYNIATHDFEIAWTKCAEALSQGCNRLRAKKKIHNSNIMT